MQLTLLATLWHRETGARASAYPEREGESALWAFYDTPGLAQRTLPVQVGAQDRSHSLINPQ